MDEFALLFRRSRHTHQPLERGELRREIRGRLQGQVASGRRACGHRHRIRCDQVVANGPNRQGVRARCQVCVGEPIAPLGVANHRHREGSAVTASGHDDTLHLPLCLGANGSGECRRPLGTGMGRGREEEQYQERRDRGGEEPSSPHELPPTMKR